MRGGEFDIVVLVLTGARLDGQNPATMGLVEIAVGKLIVLLGLRLVRIVDAEIPLGVFAVAVRGDKPVLGLRRRLMLAPCVPLVVRRPTLLDQLARVCVGALVQLGRHAAPTFGSDSVDTVPDA